MKNMIKILMLAAALVVVVLARETQTDALIAEPVAEQPQWSGQEPLQYTTGGVIVFTVYADSACSGNPTFGPTNMNNDSSLCQSISASGISIYFRIACLANDTVVGTTYGTAAGCSANANLLPSAPSGSCYPIPTSATGGIPMYFKGICLSTSTPAPAPIAPEPVVQPVGPPVVTGTEGGEIQLNVYSEAGCSLNSNLFTKPLQNNISLCQKVTHDGISVFLRTACLSNDTVVAYRFQAASCMGEPTRLPNGPSGQCTPFPAIWSAKAYIAYCPNHAIPSNSGSRAPSSAASSLQVVFSVASFALIIGFFFL
jgi:hypothetical protein